MATPPWSPRKVTFTDLDTSTTLIVQFNPENLDENLDVDYSELTVPGLSHKVLQYTNTNNEKFPIKLFFRATSATELQRMRMARRFLKSLCYPRANAASVIGGAPPRVLVVWPRMLSMTCVFRSVNFKHLFFTRYGQSRVYTCDIGVQEIRDVRLSSQDVFDDIELRYGDESTPEAPAVAETRGAIVYQR